MDFVVEVIDKSERGNAAWFKTKVFHHALWGSERELAWRWETLGKYRFLEAVFKIVDCKIVVAIKAYEVVTISFMIAEKEILAVHAAIVKPPAASFFDGFAFGVIVVCERYVVFCEICEYSFFSCHSLLLFMK